MIASGIGVIPPHDFKWLHVCDAIISNGTLIVPRCFHNCHAVNHAAIATNMSFLWATVLHIAICSAIYQGKIAT